ncbi:hypothetical protein PITC_018460 [Penicillium italicum]|uniref:Uncharacterized protein n=1 Tax=Penicillium italicum TaxID=40296 RepID=A0A0A2LAU8_PENIT|nr:hypothetical protein PITC_018460 [Penicillium italicum]
MSRDCGLLYGLWFLMSKALDGFISETTITRLISPQISEGDVEGYGAPYQHLPAYAKPTTEHFAHIGTALPQFFLKYLRETPLWKVCEAICGPRNFSDLNTLALLSERADTARYYWQEKQLEDQKETIQERLKIVVVFGDRNPLPKGYKETFVHLIGKDHMADWAPDGIWLQNAGHFPMEDKPEDVANLIARLT